MPSKDELNEKLFALCKADVIDYEAVESLLKQGAEPLGKIDDYGDDNVYGAFVYHLLHKDIIPEDLYFITDLFLRYGMDITKPAVPYDVDGAWNPVRYFPFLTEECVLRTLRLLLDHGLSSDDAWECWGHGIEDYLNVGGSLCEDESMEEYYGYIRKLMLIASYPHVLNESDGLKREIWYDYNHYDLLKFRNWNDFSIEVDTSHCARIPDVCGSVVSIIEKSSGKVVWKYGVCLKPEGIAKAGTED